MLVWLFTCARCASLGSPPEHPPPELESEFLMGGRVPLDRFFVDDTYGGEGSHYKFPRAQVDRMVEQASVQLRPLESLSPSALRSAAAKWPPTSQYKRQVVYAALVLHRDLVAGQACAVIGSMEPWVEAALLSLGASTVVTIEYNRLTYDHPQLTTIAGPDFPALYAAQSPYRHRFSLVVSISAFDHDGLGRYGDPVNPNGDLEAMQCTALLLAPAGRLLLTIPLGPDVVVWNLHRRYGSLRLPLMLDGWRVIDSVGGLSDWVDTSNALLRSAPEVGSSDSREHHAAVASSSVAASELLSTPRNWRQTIEPVWVLSPRPLPSGSTQSEL